MLIIYTTLSAANNLHAQFHVTVSYGLVQANILLAAGSRIGKFILDQGDGRNNRNPQCAGRLQRDDYFTVKFDISNADST